MDAHASHDIQEPRQDVLHDLRRADGADLHHGGCVILSPAYPKAIIVALIVATIKGSLVALFFMHLSNERKLIYYVLTLTVVFFIFLMFVPLFTVSDKIPGTTVGTSW